MNRALHTAGGFLARYLTKPGHAHSTSPATDQALLRRALRPCDVLLVEGHTRISTAIKYLTQSTWSHAALYVGPGFAQPGPGGEALSFIEADMIEGVRAVGLSSFAGCHCRICRPIGLSPEDQRRLIAFALGCLGRQYDLKNVLDLARYLLPTPPVPPRFRRRMIAFGSGDPTRAICSTLIAQAFQSIHYPILPETGPEPLADPHCAGCANEILHARRCELFVPRDFDVSPYFQVIKPSVAAEFDYHALTWA